MWQYYTTPLGRVIFMRLLDRRGVTIDQLVHHVYGHRADGGPLGADQVIRFYLWELGFVLRTVGHPSCRMMRGKPSLYAVPPCAEAFIRDSVAFSIRQDRRQKESWLRSPRADCNEAFETFWRKKSEDGGSRFMVVPSKFQGFLIWSDVSKDCSSASK